MKSSTKTGEPESVSIIQWQEPDWGSWLAAYGDDNLEELAQTSGALRRQRKVKSAVTLLRLVMAYAVCDWSLRLVGIWATLQGIVQVSDVALLYRFRRCQRWLGLLVGSVLQQRSQMLQQASGVRVRLVDATVISRPGSTGTDWRIHASFDLGQMCLDGLELSDAHGRESLARFPARADEILIADRIYALASSLGPLLAHAARLVVRVGWNNVPLQTPTGDKLGIPTWLSTLNCLCERSVQVSTPQGVFTLRLIACPLPSEKAQAARERVSQQARKKGKQLNPHSYLAAGFVLVLTNLPAETWEPSRVLWLYRLRWQIELHFKRMKSLLAIDHLRAQDPRLVQTYLLAKLLAALLLEHFVLQVRAQQPAWFAAPRRPLSLWRLSVLLWSALRNLIVGHLSFLQILTALPFLQRYLCDTPRSRSQQLARAQAIICRFQGI